MAFITWEEEIESFKDQLKAERALRKKALSELIIIFGCVKHGSDTASILSIIDDAMTILKQATTAEGGEGGGE